MLHLFDMFNVLGAYSWVNIRFLLEGAWVTVVVSVLSIILKATTANNKQ